MFSPLGSLVRQFRVKGFVGDPGLGFGVWGSLNPKQTLILV